MRQGDPKIKSEEKYSEAVPKEWPHGFGIYKNADGKREVYGQRGASWTRLEQQDNGTWIAVGSMITLSSPGAYRQINKITVEETNEYFNAQVKGN